VKTSDYVSGGTTGAMFLLSAMRQKTPQGSDILIKECSGYPGLMLVDCPGKSSSGSIIKIGDIVAFKESKNQTTGISFTKSGVSYSLSLLRSSQFIEGDDIFSQIISTFKFAD